MKTLKISDDAHAILISILGRLIAETGKMKTYSDAIEVILGKSVTLSLELPGDVEGFLKNHPQLGFATKEEFIQDTVRFRLTSEEKYTPHDPVKGRSKK